MWSWRKVPHGSTDGKAVRGITSVKAKNSLLDQDNVIDFPLKPSDLSRYDEVLYD